MIRSHHWTPEYIETLYLDEHDMHGLYYWYQDIKDYNRELKESIKK